MILHFLGLDHIGHVLGAVNPTIDKKLLEMDEIIKNIYEKFVLTQKNVIFITGDHGMKDAGGHGGSSRDEILVPLIVLGLKCEKNNETHDQVDVATSVAILLGADVPEPSNGVMIPELLEFFNDEEKLFVLNHTSERLLKKIRTQLGEELIENKGKSQILKQKMKKNHKFSCKIP